MPRRYYRHNACFVLSLRHDAVNCCTTCCIPVKSDAAQGCQFGPRSVLAQCVQSSCCCKCNKPLIHPRSTLPLEETTRAHEGDALIHDYLAHPEVIVYPLAHFCVWGYALGFETGASQQVTPMSAIPLYVSSCHRPHIRFFGEVFVWSSGRGMGWEECSR